MKVGSILLIRRYVPIFGTLCFVASLLSGCGNQAGTIRQIRYHYMHQTLITPNQIPNHFGTGIGLGDSQSWINAKWGKPHVMKTESPGNETVVYQGHGTVTFTNHRLSSIEISASIMGLQSALKVAKQLLPSDYTLVTHHQAASTSHQMLYQYQSKKLASLFKAKIWRETMYEVPGMVYIVFDGNTDFKKISSISIGVQNPNII